MQARLIFVLLAVAVLWGIGEGDAAAQSPGGRFAWGGSMGGAEESPVTVTDCAVDSVGNVFVVGYYEGTADFNPGEGTFERASFNGGTDAFVIKIDNGGGFVWAKFLVGASSEFAQSVAVDAAGNLYIGGFFAGSTDFNPGASSVSQLTADAYDPFIAKWTNDGAFVWVRQITGAGSGSVHNLAVTDGGIAATGYFTGTADFNPGSGQSLLAASGNGRNPFVFEWTADGNFDWAGRLAVAGDGEGLGIAAQDDGVVLAGYVNGDATFNTSKGPVAHTSQGDDGFVCRFNASGVLDWAEFLGGTGRDGANGVAIDSLGNVCVVGEFEDIVDFDPGAGVTAFTAVLTDGFLWSLTNEGELIWARQLSGVGALSVADVAIDFEDGWVFVGTAAGISDADPGIGVVPIAGAGSDPFVERINALGEFVWLNHITGSLGLGKIGVAVAMNQTGAPHAVGVFEGTVDLDGSDTGTFTVSNQEEGEDGFIVKLSAPAASLFADVNNDGVVDAVDIQLVINAALGLSIEFDADVDGNSVVNAVDIQLVINAALGV